MGIENPWRLPSGVSEAISFPRQLEYTECTPLKPQTDPLLDFAEISKSPELGSLCADIAQEQAQKLERTPKNRRRPEDLQEYYRFWLNIRQALPTPQRLDFDTHFSLIPDRLSDFDHRQNIQGVADYLYQLSSHPDYQQTKNRLLQSFIGQVSPEVFNQVGESIVKATSDGAVYAGDIQLYLPHDTTVDPDWIQNRHLRAAIIDSYIDAKVLRKTKNDKVSVTSWGKTNGVGWGSLESARIAKEFHNHTPQPITISSLQDISETYEAYHQRTLRQEIPITKMEGQANPSILYLTDILYGYNATDKDFVEQIVTHLENLPPNQRPTACMVSGILWGDWSMRQKDRNTELVLDQNQQFAASHLLLSRLSKLGIQIIYSMSSEDWEVCRNGTIGALSNFEGFVPYYGQEILQRRTGDWNKHLNFWVNTAFEYCLRSGRSLYSAEQVQELTGGIVKMNEYYLLVDAYHRLTNHLPLPDYYQSVINTSAIPLPGKEFADFQFTDDPLLKIRQSHAKRDNPEFNIDTRYLGNKLSSTPLYQIPTDSLLAYLKSVTRDKDGGPDAVTGMHHQELLIQGVQGETSEHFLVSTPGFTNTKIVDRQRGAVASAGRGPGYRSRASRRRELNPGAVSHEISPDGVHVFQIYNSRLLEISQAIHDPHFIPIFNDWQNGSDTARPDLQVKLFDYAWKLAADHPVIMAWIGDFIQNSDIYRSFPFESQRTGLTRSDSQTKFVESFTTPKLAETPPEHYANVLKQIVLPGNHEFRRGFQNSGNARINWLVQLLQMHTAAKLGFDAANDTVRYINRFESNANHIPDWLAMIDIEGFKTLMTHLLLEKNSKSGQTPIYSTSDFLQGAGTLFKDISAIISAHTHSASVFLTDDVLSIVPPSLADTSPYELRLGYRSVVGADIFRFGGHLPPAVITLTDRALHNHQIESGFYSPKSLSERGFKDDRHYDPQTHGFLSGRSAIQKQLLSMINEIRADSNSTSSTDPRSSNYISINSPR